MHYPCIYQFICNPYNALKMSHEEHNLYHPRGSAASMYTLHCSAFMENSSNREDLARARAICSTADIYQQERGKTHCFILPFEISHKNIERRKCSTRNRGYIVRWFTMKFRKQCCCSVMIQSRLLELNSFQYARFFQCCRIAVILSHAPKCAIICTYD